MEKTQRDPRNTRLISGGLMNNAETQTKVGERGRGRERAAVLRYDTLRILQTPKSAVSKATATLTPVVMHRANALPAYISIRNTRYTYLLTDVCRFVLHGNSSLDRVI